MIQFDDHFLRRLEPQITRLRLLGAGYAPVPANGKRPGITGYPKLAVKPPTERRVTGWTRKPAQCRNTGIICGLVRVIDLDVDDPHQAAECRSKICEIVGHDMPWRIGRYPRVAFFARSADPARRTARHRFLEGMVEFHGHGAHVVVDGIHPDTGQPYSWPNQPLWEVMVDHLPILTPEHENAIVEQIGRLLGGRPSRSVSLTASTAASARAAPGRVPVGQRNEALFHMIKDKAPSCETEAELLKWAMVKNGTVCTVPLDAEEIGRTVQQVWRYKLDGKLLVSGCEATAMIPKSDFDRLKGDTDALALYVGLQLAHGAKPGKEFAVTCGAMTKSFEMGVARLRRARDCLIAKGFLGRAGGRGVAGDPVRYSLVR